MTYYVTFSIAAMIIYTIAELVISSVSGITHDSLTVAFMGVFGGELFLCAMLKKLGLKENGDEE